MISSLLDDIVCVFIFIMASANHDSGVTGVSMLNCSLFNHVALSFETTFAFSFT